MSGMLRVTILGCGSSLGAPRADGDWGKCDPDDARNLRSRCGLLLQKWNNDGAAERAPERATTVLIDTPPELRQQLARARPAHLDAVIYSHDHADQVHGIDDVRSYFLKRRQSIPCFMDAATRVTLDGRFGYCFRGAGPYPPILAHAGVLRAGDTLAIDGPGGPLEVLPLLQDHGFSSSLGFRIGPAAYSNDVVGMPPETFAALAGLDLWILDALREAPAPSHAHLALSLEWIARLRPAHAVLTNLHVEFDYARLAARLPRGVEPAYDGWSVDLDL
jgi:phosphoribosyl 1,2-cyclic phosphate phosphodiesterase